MNCIDCGFMLFCKVQLVCNALHMFDMFVYLQGALYIVLGNNRKNISTKRSWEIVSKIWPTLTQAQHSEKPSILNLIDQIVTKTVKNAESIAVKTVVCYKSHFIIYSSMLLVLLYPRKQSVGGIMESPMFIRLSCKHSFSWTDE